MTLTFAAIIVVLLVVAAGFDVSRFIIPNMISALLVFLFVLGAIMLPLREPLWSYPAAAAMVFVGGLALYAFKVLGAGDVKLLTAMALWAGMQGLPDLLLFVAIGGGGLALVLIVLRRLLLAAMTAFVPVGSFQLPKVLVTGEDLPYGVAIAAGGVWLVLTAPYLGGLIPS